MNFVADASSLVPLFVPEHNSATAEKLLDLAEAVALPKLAIVEVAASFFRCVRKGILAPRQAQGAARTWAEMLGSGGLILYEDSRVLETAGRIAIQLNHSLQDCIYLELARSLDFTLLTGDRVFSRKAVDIYPKIITI